MRALKFLLLIAVFCTFVSAQASAATATAQASVSATITPVTSISLERDDNSVKSRGSATQVVFNKAEPAGSNFMYAPYVTEKLNWHVAKIASNAASMTLTMSVSGTVGPKNLADILYVWFGGFWRASDGGSEGGESGDWEPASSFKRTMSKTFIGSAPFNYRLNIEGISGSTTPYTGTITFTLTTT